MIHARQSECPECNATKPSQGRQFLVLEDGTRFYFPKRLPKALTFRIRDKDPDDQYARLYSDTVVDTVRLLHLPRYGMANYVQPTLDKPPTQDEAEVLKNLSRAGKRLIGFCRTNLFKRLESSGSSFLLSIQRHIVRNFIYLHAIESGKPLPIGTQDAALFDTREDDLDADTSTTPSDFFDGEANHTNHTLPLSECKSLDDLRQQAVSGYEFLSQHYRTRFDWLRPTLFVDDLAKHLQQDAERLFSILKLAGPWQADKDAKLSELYKLLTKKHRAEKILVFTQFADTVAYLDQQLRKLGLSEMAAVTGDTDDPSAYARRFSPESNHARDKIAQAEELRVLVATDVLSEGQNLQDAAIVVNYDLPWAIIRLIQRAGRVD
ncbi:MAG: C-terminal helicase domain-containing protein, partial [Limisphaerales bacterium]